MADTALRAEHPAARHWRSWASIVGISAGTGLVIGTAISQGSLILFLGYGLLVGGYSLNIFVQREIAKEST